MPAGCRSRAPGVTHPGATYPGVTCPSAQFERVLRNIVVIIICSGTPIPEFFKIGGTGMSRRRQICEGKGKLLFEGPEPGTLVQHFKYNATAKLQDGNRP